MASANIYLKKEIILSLSLFLVICLLQITPKNFHQNREFITRKCQLSNHPIKRVTCPSYWSLRRCCRSTSILSISTPINFAETYKFVQMKLICLSEDLIIPQTQLTTSKTPSCSNGRKMNWTFFSWFGGKSPIFWKRFFCWQFWRLSTIIIISTTSGRMMLTSRTPFSWSFVAAYFTAAFVLIFLPLKQQVFFGLCNF